MRQGVPVIPHCPNVPLPAKSTNFGATGTTCRAFPAERASGPRSSGKTQTSVSTHSLILMLIPDLRSPFRARIVCQFGSIPVGTQDFILSSNVAGLLH